MASIDELVQENMPVILDETFAFFDDERLGKTLEFLNQNFGEKQIIILTCTQREKSVLEARNIPYNQMVLE